MYADISLLNKIDKRIKLSADDRGQLSLRSDCHHLLILQPKVTQVGGPEVWAGLMGQWRPVTVGRGYVYIKDDQSSR